MPERLLLNPQDNLKGLGINKKHQIILLESSILVYTYFLQQN